MLLEEPAYAPSQALEAAEEAMRQPQPAGHLLRAQTFRVREYITKEHSFMDRLKLVTREYDFSAHVGGSHEDYTVVIIVNER